MSLTQVSTISESSTTVSREYQPLALTEKQKGLIEKTWKIVEEDIGMLKGGILLFMRIFELCPPALKLFKKFSDIPNEQLPENEDLQSHGLQVMETVALAVSSLNNTEELVVVLRELGGAHGSHNLQQAHFDLVGQSLLWTLEQGLGKEFTAEVKAAWIAMYGLVATEMKEGLQEYKEFSDSL
uniref:Neuroglobin-like protein n=1 Tax=Halichondria panicea TaxID=6063 RepID=A0A6C0SLH6_HALPA|nr:neuroglobin-like protein [Halichondria panicea]